MHCATSCRIFSVHGGLIKYSYQNPQQLAKKGKNAPLAHIVPDCTHLYPAAHENKRLQKHWNRASCDQSKRNADSSFNAAEHGRKLEKMIQKGSPLSAKMGNRYHRGCFYLRVLYVWATAAELCFYMQRA